MKSGHVPLVWQKSMVSLLIKDSWCMTFLLNVTIEWHCRVTSNSCMTKMKIILSPCHISIFVSATSVYIYESHHFRPFFFVIVFFFIFKIFNSSLIYYFYARLYVLSSVLVLISSFLKTLLCHFLLQTRVNWFIGKTRVISFLVLCFFSKMFFSYAWFFTFFPYI